MGIKTNEVGNAATLSLPGSMYSGAFLIKTDDGRTRLEDGPFSYELAEEKLIANNL